MPARWLPSGSGIQANLHAYMSLVPLQSGKRLQHHNLLPVVLQCRVTMVEVQHGQSVNAGDSSASARRRISLDTWSCGRAAFLMAAWSSGTVIRQTACAHMPASSASVTSLGFRSLDKETLTRDGVAVLCDALGSSGSADSGMSSEQQASAVGCCPT